MQGTVQLSQIDGQVYIRLGDLTVQQLSETVVGQIRDEMIAKKLVDLNISHQNHRGKSYRFSLNPGQTEYPMPDDFANVVYAQFSAGVGSIRWAPLDLQVTNFTALGQKRQSDYPAIAFIEGGVDNPGVRAVLSWYPSIAISYPLQIEVWYTDSTLPARSDEAVMPLQDIFLPLIVLEICVACIALVDIPEDRKEWLFKLLVPERDEWRDKFSKLINRSPAQAPVRKQRFNQGRSFGPGGRGWGW